MYLFQSFHIYLIAVIRLEEISCQHWCSPTLKFICSMDVTKSVNWVPKKWILRRAAALHIYLLVHIMSHEYQDIWPMFRFCHIVFQEDVDCAYKLAYSGLKVHYHFFPDIWYGYLHSIGFSKSAVGNCSVYQGWWCVCDILECSNRSGLASNIRYNCIYLLGNFRVVIWLNYSWLHHTCICVSVVFRYLSYLLFFANTYFILLWLIVSNFL
jgi:hypothetical protein